MNATLRSLADLCRAHPLDEKVLVVPSFIAGRRLGESLAREAGSWAHLRFVTLRTLAGEILERAGPGSAAKPMTPAAELALLDRIARELQDEGKLAYFGRSGVPSGLVHAFHRALRDLRLDGLTGADIRAGRFVVGRKGEELAELADRYERALDAQGLLDGPALLSAATAAAAKAPLAPAWTLVLADTPSSRVESAFLAAAAGDRLVLVPGDPVFGLERPRRFWPAAGRPEPGLLSWLFEPREAPPERDGTRIEIFRALGPANECREILRRLYDEKIPFDHAEVLTPPGSPHAAAFYLLAARTALPVTFGEGLPVSFTSPGRLFFGLVDWLGNDFASALLGRLIENGDLVLPSPAGGAVPARTAFRHLRNALIGWGRDRYSVRLAALRDQKAAESALRGGRGDAEGDELDDVRRAELAAAVAEIDRLSGSIGRLLSLFPRPEAAGAVGLGSLSGALAKAVEDFGRDGPEPDRAARRALLARLEEIGAESGPRPLPLREALELVRASVSGLRVGASPPAPGALHVSGSLSGSAAGRPLTFVVGLDEATFPGRGLQDPILLDEERAALSDSLPTSADALRSKLYGLAAALASLRGRIVLSYPSYNVIEGRESFPSSVVLQAFRLARRDADLDYAALDRELAEAAGFLPGRSERAFDERDWWLDRLARRDPAVDGPGSVAANFPGLAAGLAAESARAAGALTAFEGIVDLGPLRAEVDPLAGRTAVMSATRLELLARCPFAYFLRHVLKVRPPEEIAFDRARWLDPLQRGSLVHEILCELMTEVRRKGEEVSARRHGERGRAIAEDLMARGRERIPPPSEAIFESERRDVLETVEIFLSAEEKRDEKGEPLEFEKPIDEEEIGLGGGRSFRLSGSIDRVDRLGPDTYRILDYKTGNPADYEELVEFGRGRMIQHALYAVALERVLAREAGGKRPRVTRSGYLFPSRRGEGLERIVKDFDRGRLRSLLNDLLALLGNGWFIAGPEAKCGYCDYARVCVAGGPEATKSKRKSLERLLAEVGLIVKARKAVEESLRIFEAYDKLGEYK